MQAKELMTRSVVCLSPKVSVEEIARKMKSMDVGFMPICSDDRLIGTVTDRDIVLRGIAAGKNTADCTAEDIMTTDVYWCYEDQSAEEVADYMAKREIRRVLIIDRSKRLVGVISIGDLAKGGEPHKAGEAIGTIAEAPPARVA